MKHPYVVFIERIFPVIAMRNLTNFMKHCNPKTIIFPIISQSTVKYSDCISAESGDNFNVNANATIVKQVNEFTFLGSLAIGISFDARQMISQA